MAKKTPQEGPDTPPAQGYTVLARRYRPQSFEEIVGQEAVSRALVNALTSNRVAHAYLFTGARGVGKTSTARILAKCLNCETGPTPLPCNRCDICLSITAGEDVDVLEFDAASNRGIDEIRNIRTNVQYRPSRARFKIYIIDEVHMLSTPAFNALLKTLEEPPPHVKFIFATTDPQKIPVTILSRCQRFDLGGITLPLIKAHLSKIAAKEGIDAEDEALELVARRAAGSMRDAQSLLDQLLAFGGDRLTAAQVHQLLGTAGEEHILGLAEAVVARDARLALERLDDAAAQGFQMSELVDQLMSWWRDLMLTSAAGNEARGLNVSPSSRDRLRRQAGELTLDAILAGLDILSSTRARLRDSSHARTLVEMALTRLCRLGDLLSIAQIAQMIGQAPRTAPAGRSAPVSPALPEGVKKNAVTASTPPSDDQPMPLTAETMPTVWAALLQRVGRMLASDLEKSNLPAILGPNTLVLRFPVTYNKERENCERSATTTRVEEQLRKLTGRPWTIRVESSGEAISTAAAEASRPAAAPWRNLREEAEQVPLVRRALEALGAQILRVDEGFGLLPGGANGADDDLTSTDEGS